MKNSLPALFILIFSGYFCIAQTGSVKPDSIIHSETRKILGHRFEFSLRSDYPEHTFLKITNLDNTAQTPFTQDIDFKGGDCNFTETVRAEYEVKKDKLLAYIEDVEAEHFDDRHPHSKTTYIVHEWVFRKNGEIVSLGQKSSRKHPEVEQEVRMKLDP
jgi:hypothetical protein